MVYGKVNEGTRWVWELFASNGISVAQSSQTYGERWTARRAFMQVVNMKPEEVQEIPEVAKID